ncbi:MAG: hypothetical protein AAF560_34150 [Acidobacteriota bacterium]
MTWNHILCADWAKGTAARAVCHADVERRRVRLVEHDAWTLSELLELAREGLDGSVLVGIDAVLGVPDSYLRRAAGWREGMTFLDWLAATSELPRFFEEVKEPEQLSAGRPFFAVKPGAGGRKAFEQAVDWSLWRRVDRTLGGNSVFIVSGIPGTVGSASRELWRELRELLPDPERGFEVWPWEGELVPSADRVVLAEGYPKAAYGTALADSLPATARTLAKNQRMARVTAYDELAAAEWVATQDVELPERAAVIADGDRFDAAIMATAWLRCVLEDHPLVAQPVDPIAEGGIVDAGVVIQTAPAASPG